MSGFSSGGGFAHIMQMAHSERVKGVGIMNGVAYGSTKDQLTDDDVTIADLKAQAIAEADANEIAAAIDSLDDNMPNNFAYILGGELDEVTPLKNQAAIVDTYQEYGATVAFKVVEEGTHRPIKGETEEILEWLYEKITDEFEPSDDSIRPKDYGSLAWFDQHEIATSLGIDFDEAGIREHGLIYIPDACREVDANCNTHVAFHGSYGNGRKLARHYTRFAAVNNIIMLFPQSSEAWDVFGEIDPDDFTNQLGDYPTFVMEMVDMLEACIPGFNPFLEAQIVEDVDDEDDEEEDEEEEDI